MTQSTPRSGASSEPPKIPNPATNTTKLSGTSQLFSRASGGFKILNPELFLAANKKIYIPGTLLFLAAIGVIGWTVWEEKQETMLQQRMKRRKHSAPAGQQNITTSPQNRADEL
mmetsp:Transcript_9289/g.34363  ORF Transcript_9289/g.34363 Transcript_9289/m.34363 type:complete len:114 (+) Transcript_9289:3-344(+)